MKNLKQITEYVEGIFELYHADKRNFFYEYDDETDEWVEVPLFIGNDGITKRH